MNYFTKQFQCSLHSYSLFCMQTDVWVFLLSLSAWFQLQVLAEVVWMFAGQVCTFSRLCGASEVLRRNCFYSETEIC